MANQSCSERICSQKNPRDTENTLRADVQEAAVRWPQKNGPNPKALVFGYFNMEAILVLLLCDFYCHKHTPSTTCAHTVSTWKQQKLFSQAGMRVHLSNSPPLSASGHCCNHFFQFSGLPPLIQNTIIYYIVCYESSKREVGKLFSLWWGISSSASCKIFPTFCIYLFALWDAT